MITTPPITYDIKLGAECIGIDGEPAAIVLPTIRPYLRERLADLRIAEPNGYEIDELVIELDRAERSAEAGWELVDFWADHHRELMTALSEVVRLLKEDRPEEAMDVAEKALGERE